MPALADATRYRLAARFTQPNVMRLFATRGADAKVIHESNYGQGEGYERREERTTAIMAALGTGGGTAWMPIDRAERDAPILVASSRRRAGRRCQRGVRRRPYGPRLGARAEVRRGRGPPRRAGRRRFAGGGSFRLARSGDGLQLALLRLPLSSRRRAAASPGSPRSSPHRRLGTRNASRLPAPVHRASTRATTSSRSFGFSPPSRRDSARRSVRYGLFPPARALPTRNHGKLDRRGAPTHSAASRPEAC